MSDLLLAEIEEELRRDRAKAFWKRYGTLIVGAAAVFIAIVVGWRGYDSWQRSKAAGDGDRLFNLMQQSEQAASNDNLKQMNALAGSGSKGAGALARFVAASDKARLGDAAAAIKDFDALTNDSSLDMPLRDMARLRAALLVFEQGDAAGAMTRAGTLTSDDNQFRHAARELMGLAAYKKKDLPAAARWFEMLVTDLAAPAATRNRGQMMLALLAADGIMSDKAGLPEESPLPKE